MITAEAIREEIHLERKQRVIWTPQPGPQAALLACPVEDLLFGGARGGGKSDGMLGDWLAHQRTYGKHARGLLVRRSFKEFSEILRRARVLFYGLAIFKSSTKTFHFEDGATLELAYLKRDKDAETYQGFSFTWLCVEEMGNFATSRPIDLLRATLRTGDAKIPTYFRATANPGGIGHGWIKQRYIDRHPRGNKAFYDSEMETWRIFIPSRLEHNKILQRNDPGYWKRIKAATYGDSALERAWLLGDWDIVAGGLLTSVWDSSLLFIPPFDVGKATSWRKDRTLDWGSSHPYAVCYWAESDGTTAPNGINYPAGSVFLFDELYGWTGKANEGTRELVTTVAEKIVDYEAAWEFGVYPGPADSSIFDVQTALGTESIASQFGRKGVYWLLADKRPGSRIAGAEKARSMLHAAKQFELWRRGEVSQRPTEAGLWIFNTCPQWKRTVPIIPRDERRPDDADTRAEDHIYDATRYRLVQLPPESQGGTAGGAREEWNR